MTHSKEKKQRAPKPLKPWNGVRSAKTFGPVCPQYDILFKAQYSLISEDCLYLNVYSPDIAPKRPKAVMVWIHGGGFFCGSGNDNLYGPEYLMKNDVVLVTLNYRLATLGFLCLDTEEIPGNAGMKDQVAALKWVKDNILKFGGDPENVTIFGESAGGASVSYHLVSPMSKGLFRRAIMQSGSTFNCWSEVTDARKRALLLASNLGCNSKDDKEIAKFLKSCPVESLLFPRLPLTLMEDEKEYPELFLSVVSEKKFDNIETFYNGDCITNIRDNIHEGIDIIMGYTADEGLILPSLVSNVEKAIKQANAYAEYFVPKIVLLNNTPLQCYKIGEQIKEFYFGKEEVNMSNIYKLIKYFSSIFFWYDIVRWCRIATCIKRNKIFLYKFTCKSELNILNEIFGGFKLYANKNVTCHADDIPYLFTNKFSKKKVEIDSKEYSLVTQVTKLWTNFAKFGNPTPDASLQVTWPEYNLQDQSYINIGEELVVEKCPDKEEVEFWDSVFNKYCPERNIETIIKEAIK